MTGRKDGALAALLLVVLMLTGCAYPPGAGGGPITLRDGTLSATIDPATLHITMADDATGQAVTVSNAQPGLSAAAVQAVGGRALSWRVGEVAAHAEIVDGALAVRFSGPRHAEVTFPVLGRTAGGGEGGGLAENIWLLPIAEGHRVPDDDADWAAHLAHQSPTNTLEGLSVPFLGVMRGDAGPTAVWMLEDPLNNTLRYTGDGHTTPIGLRITHRFNPAMDDTRYGVRFRFGGDSAIGPALAYRGYLERSGRLVTLADKIADNPRVDRLRGALHAYVWDDGLISAHDLRHAKPIAAALVAASDSGPADSPQARVWSLLDDAGREAAAALVEEEWPSMYLKRELAAALSRVMAQHDDPAAMRGEVYRAFDGLLDPPSTWGDGVSIAMLNAMHQAGIEHALLLTGGLHTADQKPYVPAFADQLGYLFGPYDSYHSIHAPDTPEDDTWDTAQFDQHLWETGGIRNEDGSYSAGFKQRGRHLAPIAARPYVEARVNMILGQTPHSAWFVDCDAFGQLFDDYTPGRECSKLGGMVARLDRLDWLSGRHGLVVGSEGGSAYAANAIHFAHGITSPVIGWGDPQLTERDSEHYLGGWWPPTGPAVFFKQVPLAPGYGKVHFDPRYRLPLYQAVFHDCVVATHHWGYHSLKFSDQVQTVALIEQLYNVPPLVHLNRDAWREHGDAIARRMAFFAPIHRDAALLPLTSYRWLDDGGFVQQTTFGERFVITVNFGDAAFVVEGDTIEARSAVCLDRETDEMSRYSP
ncbi:hypothetical protein OT109_03960 [Phycisphaeraceae bacterium D3-23]